MHSQQKQQCMERENYSEPSVGIEEENDSLEMIVEVLAVLKFERSRTIRFS